MSIPAPQLHELYESTYAPIVRTLRILGVREEAVEDAGQDVFEIACRKWDTFEPSSSLRAWVYGITRRVAADYRRRQRTDESRRIAYDIEATIGPSSPFADVFRAQGAHRLGALLAQIPAKRREVFVLADIEGFTGPEISEALGLPLEAIYSRLRKARNEFAKALERQRAHSKWVETGAWKRSLSVFAFLLWSKPARASRMGACAGLAVGATAILLFTTNSGPAPRITRTLPVSSLPLLVEPDEAPPTIAPEPVPSSAPLKKFRPAPKKPRGPRQSPAKNRPLASSSIDDLQAELLLIEAALQAGRDARWGEAKGHVAEHHRRFPSGQLADERRALAAVFGCNRKNEEPTLPGLAAMERERCAFQARTRLPKP